jgi:hypothetical protein
VRIATASSRALCAARIYLDQMGDGALRSSAEKMIGAHDVVTWDRGDFVSIGMRPHEADDPSQYGYGVLESGIDFCDKLGELVGG